MGNQIQKTQNSLQVTEKNVAAFREMDKAIQHFNNSKETGFMAAISIASIISDLNRMITPEVMKIIMPLQGSKLGFKTDKDKEGGYKEPEVKRCFIEASISGLLPVMNEWNIIAGNMYVTKEGFTSLLKNNTPGLTDVRVVKGIPENKFSDKGGFHAIVVVAISWTLNGNEDKQTLEFDCKGAGYSGKCITSSESYQGKAERKAKAWLHAHVTGTNLYEGDSEEAEAVNISHTEVKDDDDPLGPVTDKEMGDPDDLRKFQITPGPVLNETIEKKTPLDELHKSASEEETVLIKAPATIKNQFQILVREIGREKVSAFFASGKPQCTTFAIEQDYPRMEKIIDDKEGFKTAVIAYYDIQTSEKGDLNI